MALGAQVGEKLLAWTGVKQPANLRQSWGERQSVRLKRRRGVTAEEEAAGTLADMADVGGAGASRGPQRSGAGDVMMPSEPCCDMDATPPRGLLPMSDEEDDGAPGPSGWQAAEPSTPDAEPSTPDAEPEAGPEPAAAAAEDRAPGSEQGADDQTRTTPRYPGELD